MYLIGEPQKLVLIANRIRAVDLRRHFLHIAAKSADIALVTCVRSPDSLGNERGVLRILTFSYMPVLELLPFAEHVLMLM